MAVAGTLVALNGVAVSVRAENPPGKAGSAPVTETNVDASGRIRVHEQGTVLSQVTNLPLDAAGNLRTSGSAVVSGTVGATQSGPWSVGLDPAASSFLSNIDTATSGLRYDVDGNLKVSVAPTSSAADPSVADQSPFGFGAASAFPAGESFTINHGADTRVTSYFVQALEGEIKVFFLRAGSVTFGFRVAAGQSAIASASLAHAILADSWTFECGPSSNCVVFYSAAGY
jgi:hypothetical protein